LTESEAVFVILPDGIDEIMMEEWRRSLSGKFLRRFCGNRIDQTHHLKKNRKRIEVSSFEQCKCADAIYKDDPIWTR
jgi:hypothetical protein